MKRVNKTTVAMLIVTGICACSHPTALSPSAYASYMEGPEHGMSKEVETGMITYHIQLATPEYVVSKEMDRSSNDKVAFQKRLSELKGITFFLIGIRPKSGASAMPVSDASVVYYQGAAMSDVSLKCGSRTLSPIAYHFENNQGLSPANTIVAGFESGNTDTTDLQLVFNDRLNKNPFVKATFAHSDLSALPHLSF